MRHLSSWALILAAGCGGGSNADVDASVTPPDASPAVDAVNAATCALANPLVGYTQSSRATGEEDTAAAKFVLFDDRLNADPKPDVVDIELYDGSGTFATTPLGIGTFTLTPADASYATCGACLVFDGDVDTTAKTAVGTWLADSGTVTITALQPHLIGSISNVHLRQVDVAKTTLATTDDPSGCVSTVSSLAFDIAVTPDDQKVMTDAGAAPALRGRVHFSR